MLGKQKALHCFWPNSEVRCSCGSLSQGVKAEQRQTSSMLYSSMMERQEEPQSVSERKAVLS
eukprot:1147533-Pelagomonas_calceolata.AAC.10